MLDLRSPQAGAALLAAAAGAVDLLALTVQGGAFASIITGNLITVGYGIGSGDLSRTVPALVAVGGYLAGVLIQAAVQRNRPQSTSGPLLAECALLTIVAVISLWTTAGYLPLALSAVAMGGQSLTGLRLNAVTTYMTGALVNAARDLIAGRRKAVVTPFIQLVSLVTGAAMAALLRVVTPSAAAFLPPLLVAVAVVQFRTRTRQGASR